MKKVTLSKSGSQLFRLNLSSRSPTVAYLPARVGILSVGYFSVMLLPKMKPISAMARAWLGLVPVLPKTSPAV